MSRLDRKDCRQNRWDENAQYYAEMFRWWVLVINKKTVDNTEYSNVERNTTGVTGSNRLQRNWASPNKNTASEYTMPLRSTGGSSAAVNLVALTRLVTTNLLAYRCQSGHVYGKSAMEAHSATS